MKLQYINFFFLLSISFFSTPSLQAYCIYNEKNSDVKEIEAYLFNNPNDAAIALGFEGGKDILSAWDGKTGGLLSFGLTGNALATIGSIAIRAHHRKVPAGNGKTACWNQSEINKDRLFLIIVPSGTTGWQYQNNVLFSGYIGKGDGIAFCAKNGLGSATRNVHNPNCAQQAPQVSSSSASAICPKRSPNMPADFVMPKSSNPECNK